MNKDDTAVAFLLGIIAIVAGLSIVFAPRFLANQIHSTNANAQRQYDALSYRDDVEQQRDSGDNAHRLTEHERTVLRQILNE